MGRSLPPERGQESSEVLAGYQALPSLHAGVDRLAKTPTAPPIGSPTLAPRPSYKYRPEDDISVQPISQAGYPELHREVHRPILPPPITPSQKRAQTKSLGDLPPELQESILDHVVGSLGTQKSSIGPRNWSNAMRHPRRRQLSDLALVSKTWRPLIQERLYRHIKIRGTKAELELCGDWFLTHTHLQPYVRHIEVWVPLFEVTTEPRPRTPLRGSSNTSRQGGHATLRNARMRSDELVPAKRMFQTAGNATLEEIFGCTKTLFPWACALTIEGGHCKKSRQIQQLRSVYEKSCTPKPADTSHVYLKVSEDVGRRRFSEHYEITTLILKGSWNIIREASDFDNMASALPNMREWHCIYAKPKTDAYKAMCGVLRHFPPSISKINICLEGLNGKQPSSLAKWRKLYPEYHICKDLGLLFPQLETLTFTGHVCSSLFKSALTALSSVRDTPKLRSVDLFVRNCCREPTELDDGPSIHNWPFIQAFEQLVLEAVTVLGAYPQLDYMRIRFLDLDSPRPLLNPYFHLENSTCAGMWDTKILAALSQARPEAHFESTMDEGILDWFDGPVFSRPKSMKASSYAALAQVPNII